MTSDASRMLRLDRKLSGPAAPYVLRSREGWKVYASGIGTRQETQDVEMAVTFRTIPRAWVYGVRHGYDAVAWTAVSKADEVAP